MKNFIGIAMMFMAPLQSHAGGGMTGGSTEITQLMNNAELIAQVGEATQTTANTLMTAQSTMQQLRQLPQSVINESMSGLPVDKVNAMADAYVVMSKSAEVYKDAEDVLRKAAYDSERLGVTPSELLQHKANAAAMHGGIYRQTYDQEQEKLRRLAETSKEVQKQADTVNSIDSSVGGIQFLASQNVQVQASLADISSSIATANANAAREAELKQSELERVQKREANKLDARRRAELEAPEVTRLKLPHEFVK